MASPVHIAIYKENHVAPLIHMEQLHLMALIQGSFIQVPLIIKGKQKGHLIFRKVIAKQPVPCDKGKVIAPVAFQKGNIPAGDPQHDFIIGIHIALWVKYLVHGPLKIQQVHPV